MISLRLFMLIALSLCALPIVLMLVASLVAKLLSCRLDEANSYPCLLCGLDIGELLSLAFNAAWLAMLTLPLGIFLLMLWGVIAWVRG